MGNRGKRPVLITLALLVSVSAAGVRAESKKARPHPTLQIVTSEMVQPVLQAVLPKFLEKHAIEVQLIVRPAGEAFELARKGSVDGVVLDDPTVEEALVRGRLALKPPQSLLYAEMVVVGPASDPARIAGMASVVHAFAAIARSQSPFISRGDGSSIHRVESGIWEELGSLPKPNEAKWYVSGGGDMAATLAAAATRNGYTLADKAAWLQFKDRRQLVVVVSEDPRLQQRFALTLIGGGKGRGGSKSQAESLATWLASREAQSLIGSFALAGEYPYAPHFGLAQQ
jgi:tungstate transport system substrate-binding protein